MTSNRNSPPPGSLSDIRLRDEDRSQPGSSSKRGPKRPKRADGKAPQRKDSGPARSGPARGPRDVGGAAGGGSGGGNSGRGGGSGGGGRKSGKPAGRKAASRRGSFWGTLFRLFRRLAYWMVIVGIWGSIVAGGIVLYYGAKLPQSTDWKIPDRPPNVQIISEDGGLIANRGKTGGQKVSISSMPPYLVDAVVAIEDHRFFHHFGFDPIGFTRAIVMNLVRGRVSQGGSTLTQQLAKNLFLEHKRTIERKVQELILAIWLETKYSKQEILEMYLNRGLSRLRRHWRGCGRTNLL